MSTNAVAGRFWACSDRVMSDASGLLTARLTLRRLTGADLDWLAALHGDPTVMRYIDSDPVPAAVVASRTLPGILAEYDQLPAGLGCFAAVPRDGAAVGEGAAPGAVAAPAHPIGWIALRPAFSAGLESEQSSTELGYRLFPAAWGQGYATEGARALVRHAFAAVGVDRLVATTMTLNTGSRRVLEKAGLRLVRTFYAQWPAYLTGAEYGDVVYALNRQDWTG
jgi:RimJ/RimL family protein N-acetyltransferase